MADDRKPKSVGKKNILIMGKQAQTIELSTYLGINYIPCCSVVLMHYNEWCLPKGGFRITNVKLSTNVK